MDIIGSGACEHEWSRRGSGDLSWLECWLCGEHTPYSTSPTPPGHRQFTDETGTWCHEDCLQPDKECGLLAIEQNNTAKESER